ncbi:MAG: hypothetical protein R2867_40755 [Caldilineaceae bacterium]
MIHGIGDNEVGAVGRCPIWQVRRSGVHMAAGVLGSVAGILWQAARCG